jgi:hypothetical protein
MALLTGAGAPDLLRAAASPRSGMAPIVFADERLPLDALVRVIAGRQSVPGHAWDHPDPAPPKFDKMPPGEVPVES